MQSLIAFGLGQLAVIIAIAAAGESVRVFVASELGFWMATTGCIATMLAAATFFFWFRPRTRWGSAARWILALPSFLLMLPLFMSDGGHPPLAGLEFALLSNASIIFLLLAVGVQFGAALRQESIPFLVITLLIELLLGVTLFPSAGRT